MSERHRKLAEYFERRATHSRKAEDRARFQKIAKEYRLLASKLGRLPVADKSGGPQKEINTPLDGAP